ncbi:conjugal transfer protein [Salmonella enterica]
MYKQKLKKSDNKTVLSMYPDYRFHLSDSIIYTSDKKMLATIVIEGMPFESAKDSSIENAFTGLKDYLVGIGKDGDTYLWTHLVKERVLLDEEYEFDNNFLKRFSTHYLSTFRGGDFFKSTWYLTFGIPYTNVENGVERLEDMLHQAMSVLKPFNASVLAVEKGYISEVGDYLSLLLNKQHVSIPLSSSPLSESISDSEWYFGNDTLELRNNESDNKKFATNYVLKDFPMFTEVGHWDFLLKLPYEFIITQSFIFEAPAKTLRKIDSQLNKLNSAGDAAESQQDELLLGKDVVTSGITLFGSYHCVLTIFGDNNPDEARKNGIKVASEFITAGKGFRFTRAASAAPYVFFSHMPMNKIRPLETRRTVTNLACTFSLHNYSTGKKKGNPIGDGSAIMPLKTVSDGLYYFNTHYSDPNKNVTGQRIAGHAMILGATGTGKTTFEGAAAGFLQRFDPYMFVVDYNRSTELFVRAYGGSYFALQEGMHTGLNPWQLAEDESSPIWARLLAFLKELAKSLVRDSAGVPCSDKQAIEMDEAVEGIMRMPLSERRTSTLLQIVTDGDLRIRLNKWCESGAYAWAVDSPENTFNPMDYKKVGFDTTVILEKINGNVHPACEPVLGILFFYKTLMQREGKLMLSIIEEFWMPCNFPLTQDMIKGALKAGRLKGEMMWLTSQSPEDAINCAIFAALVQQTATKVLLPIPDATPEALMKIGLEDKEIKRFLKLTKESRTMLIKQSGSSAFAKMDLYGFDDFLPVISGTTEGIALCESIRNELDTDNPDVWIPEFIKRIKEQ